MSKFLNGRNHDYSKFDSMSTEELEMLLRMDSELDEEDVSNMDTILYITEVLAKRQKEQPTHHIADIDDAWASFKEHYEPCSGSFKSLYDFDEAESVNTTVVAKRSKKNRFIRHFSGIVAALMLIIVGGSLVTSAAGTDLGEVFAHWTEELFSFGQEPENANGIHSDMDLEQTLSIYNIPKGCIPIWSPDGYILSEFQVEMADEHEASSVYLAYYSDSSQYSIDIRNLSYNVLSNFEKDNVGVFIYKPGDTEYYIASNNKYTKAMWRYDDFECSITGDISKATIEKIIDSIYERG